MKNSHGIRLIIILVILISSASKIHSFDIISTPPIEGRVIDATTGEPIPKVVVGARWIKWTPAFADQVSGLANGETVISDKEGRYRIPGYWGFLIISDFSGIKIRTSHPLYIREGGRMYDAELGKGALNNIKQGANKGIPGTYKDGTIHYDIKLVGLEEKYKDKPGLYMQFESNLKTMENGWYWKTLRKNKIEFNLEDTFKKLFEIADVLDGKLDTVYKGYNDTYVNKVVKETKDKIKKALMEKSK